MNRRSTSRHLDVLNTSAGQNKLHPTQSSFKESWDYPWPVETSATPGEPLVEMEGVEVSYGDKQILSAQTQVSADRAKNGIWWTIRRGERWGVFGPNGKAKQSHHAPS